MAVVRPKERLVVQSLGGSGIMVGLDPAQEYDPSDPLVTAYPWAFESDTPERKTRRGKVITDVPVESATRAPGEKRRR